jgi:hypothetical protein
MTRTWRLAAAAVLFGLGTTGANQFHPEAKLSPAPVVYWSNEARRAIVPPGPDGVYGTENYGNKFPGEAAVYMGLVHLAMHDAALGIAHGAGTGGAERTSPSRPSPAAAVATAAHHVLVGLQPALGLTVAEQKTLDDRYADYLRQTHAGGSQAEGVVLGARVAAALLAERRHDGREANPRIEDLRPPPAGPGVWTPASGAALGLRLPGVQPLALAHGAQFRPEGPVRLTSAEYAADFAEVATVGSASSARRTLEQTAVALFWTDHDLRQWNDGMLRLATERDLDLQQSARMLAMAHVAGGDAMIACFDAKYAFWFWRPDQAIPQAGTDANDATAADPAWQPLRPTPSFPEYPSAHGCHSAAIAEALSAFFGTDRVPFALDSRVTGTTRMYGRFSEAVEEIESARVLSGFHFRSSDRDGVELGRQVGRYAVAKRFGSALSMRLPSKP